MNSSTVAKRGGNSFASRAVLVGVLLFAAFMHFYLLNSYPPGLDPDSAQDGMDALKPLRYNVWPFYITINSNADPLYVYTAAATTGLFGARVLALRFASAVYGLLGIAATYLCLLELGRNSLDSPTRKVTALLAIAALASSQLIALVDRMGLRFITELPLQMLSIWALARAGRAGRLTHWAVAGALAGFTQYTYPSARVLPLLWTLVIILKFWQERGRRRSFLVGLPVFALAALVALLPQAIWYAQHPDTFLARAGQTSFTQNPLYAEGGLTAVLGIKVEHYWAALTHTWLGQYNQIKEPLFAPLFLVGAGLGLLAVPFGRHKWFGAYALCGLGVMLLPDLISGDRDWPHELRLIGAYPFLAALAGLGLASTWKAARQLPAFGRFAAPILFGLVGLTMALQAREFFSLDLNYGELYWSGNIWLRRVDHAAANYINASDAPVLIPLSSYSDTVVKYLTANRAIHIRSALNTSGHWLPQPAEPITVLLPNEDDNAPWQGDPDLQWALFMGDTVYIAPPLEGMAALLPALNDSTLVYATGPFNFVQAGHAHQISSAQLPVIETLAPDFPLNTCFEPGMCLVGASYDDWRLEPGGALRVNLFWQMQHPADDDYILFVHLLDKDGNAIAGKDDYPLSHGYRTYEWAAGETIVSQTQIQLPADLGPGPYALEAGFYPPYEVKRVDTQDEAGNPNGDRAYFQHLKVALPLLNADPEYEMQASFGPIELIGYDQSPDAPGPAEPVTLTFYWRTSERLSTNYTAFVHLQSGPALVGQADVQPGNGVYPTTIWDVGEVVTTTHVVTLAPDSPGGPYQVFVGWYAYPSGERLPGSINGQPTSDGRVEVTAQP